MKFDRGFLECVEVQQLHRDVSIPASIAVARSHSLPLRRMRPVLLYLANTVVRLFPPTRFYPVKREIFNWAGCNLARGVRIVSSCRIVGTGNFSVGEDTFIGHESFISTADASVRIGSEVDIAPRMTIVAGSHEINEGPVRRAGKGTSRDVIIGDRCWIGTSVTILGGVTICDGCVVAAGSVVIQSLPANFLCAGIPAVPKKQLF